ncbi:MAG: PglZ domain-containing protein [Paludibacteraceae bacterium]
MNNLITDIATKLFDISENRLVVVFDNDGFLLRQDVRYALGAVSGRNIMSGRSLDLRMLRELDMQQHPEQTYLFVATEDFFPLDDISAEADIIRFSIARFFSRYRWSQIHDLSLPNLETVYASPEQINVASLRAATSVLDVVDGNSLSETNVIISDWDKHSENPIFIKPAEWINKTAGLLLSAIELNCWEQMQSGIDKVNSLFQEFLKEKYINIVTSACSSTAPRIVTHVLPFITKQNKAKSALIVVDGMNYWQALLLGREVEHRCNVKLSYDCIYSWLPSVTELSRQAIFRGAKPVDTYPQNPQNEKRLWDEFWKKKNLPSYQRFYQHSGIIELESAVATVGYVADDLDEMMHSAKNYKYLYDSTKRWVEEDTLIENIHYLINKGFTVYITTDHGNIETKPYKRIASSDKIGANISLRHVVLPSAAEKSLFEQQHEGHFMQIDNQSRTYFPVDREAFTSEPCVTHGGTHWLEVLIPFITVNK